MKSNKRVSLTVLAAVAVLVALLAATGPTGAQNGAPTVVSYQGQVTVSGTAYTGAGYFKFAVVNLTGDVTYWSNDGTSSGGSEPTAAVQLTVTGGLFNVLLGDTALTNMTALPASAFDGTERALRVWFNTTSTPPPDFTLLTPDRRIAAVPYALQAEEARNAWALTGNAGTTAGTNFVGTTDNQALELKVNNTRALRLEPGAGPNLIGGYSGNWAADGAFGAVIAGGGQSGNLNRVLAHMGVIGGGQNNQAGDDDGDVTTETFATVGGGANNTASGTYATIAGGTTNTASGRASMVAGGANNVAGGDYAFAAGRRAKATLAGCFVWGDSTDADVTCTTANQFVARATGGVSFDTGSNAFLINGHTTWHAGNDGTGSGMDADLLDGLHAGAFWQLTGNAGTDPATDFVGTTDAQPLVLRTANIEQARLDAAGNLGLGTTAPAERLTVRGNAHVLGEDNPAARGYTSTNLDFPNSVYVSGRYAYVASRHNNRLAIFDVSDPANIVAKGFTSENLVSSYDVYVSGRYAYVTSAGNDRLAIFDVSDPNNIVAQGFTDVNLDYPTSVYVSGRYAYVASYNNDRLAIFDVSDPNHIVALGFTSVNLDAPVSVYVSGRYAYVASYYNHHLAIFDVSDPNNIVAQGYTSTNLARPAAVYVSGRYAYVVSGDNSRLAIFDVSDPANIVAKGYTSENLVGPWDVYVSGRYAYVTSGYNNRLAIFDVSDPAHIVAKGYTDMNLSRPHSVHVSGRYAYVASFENHRLAAFELNHLESPTLETGSLQSGALDVTDNAIVGNNLHVQGGLNVGPGGALINGDVSVQGNLFAHVSVTTLTGSATLAVTQSGVVLVDNAADATITLPAAAASRGLTFTIKRLAANAVTIASAGGNIDGAATQALAAQYDFITVVSDGTNWYIVAR